MNLTAAARVASSLHASEPGANAWSRSYRPHTAHRSSDNVIAARGASVLKVIAHVCVKDKDGCGELFKCFGGAGLSWTGQKVAVQKGLADNAVS